MTGTPRNGYGQASATAKWCTIKPLRWCTFGPVLTFLPVFVLSKLFRRLMLDKLTSAHHSGQFNFFSDHSHLADANAFKAFLAPLNKTRWFVYAKRPFAGPKAVLAYLSRYTHRVAISNRRLIKADEHGVTFKVKDYRFEGRERYKTMSLATHEFIRRFLIHVLPKGLHRIRHYGLFANGNRVANLAKMRALLDVSDRDPDKPRDDDTEAEVPNAIAQPCPCCGGRMIIIETFEPGCMPKYTPQTEEIDSS